MSHSLAVFLVMQIGLCGSLVFITSIKAAWHNTCRRSLALCADNSFGLRRPSLQTFICFSRVRFIAWRPKYPFLGDFRRSSRHFWNRPRIWASACAQTPTFKPPCATSQHGGMLDKYQRDIRIESHPRPCFSLLGLACMTWSLVFLTLVKAASHACREGLALVSNVWDL